jgi:hypothetical protein
MTDQDQYYERQDVDDRTHDDLKPSPDRSTSLYAATAIHASHWVHHIAVAALMMATDGEPGPAIETGTEWAAAAIPLPEGTASLLLFNAVFGLTALQILGFSVLHYRASNAESAILSLGAGAAWKWPMVGTYFLAREYWEEKRRVWLLTALATVAYTVIWIGYVVTKWQVVVV